MVNGALTHFISSASHVSSRASESEGKREDEWTCDYFFLSRSGVVVVVAAIIIITVATQEADNKVTHTLVASLQRQRQQQ